MTAFYTVDKSYPEILCGIKAGESGPSFNYLMP
jgi:hypothetical protein